jgi:hypothetical protein
VGRVGTEAAKQAALQAVGGGVARGLGAAGGKLYQGLLKPSVRLRQEFPKVVDSLLRIGAPITRGGLGKVENMMGASAQEANQLIQAAAPTASRIAPQEIIREMAPTIRTLRLDQLGGRASQLPQVGARAAELVKQARGGGMDVQTAQQVKTRMQNLAENAYRAQERGVRDIGLDDMLNQDVARGARAAIEARVPGVSEVNTRTQELIGGRRALEAALGREGNTSFIGMRDLIGAGGGGALFGPAGAAAGAMLTRLLAHPTTGSYAAILANRASQVPIGSLLNLLSGLAEDQPENER